MRDAIGARLKVTRKGVGTRLKICFLEFRILNFQVQLNVSSFAPPLLLDRLSFTIIKLHFLLRFCFFFGVTFYTSLIRLFVHVLFNLFLFRAPLFICLLFFYFKFSLLFPFWYDFSLWFSLNISFEDDFSSEFLIFVNLRQIEDVLIPLKFMRFSIEKCTFFQEFWMRLEMLLSLHMFIDLATLFYTQNTHLRDWTVCGSACSETVRSINPSINLDVSTYKIISPAIISLAPAGFPSWVCVCVRSVHVFIHLHAWERTQRERERAWASPLYKQAPHHIPVSVALALCMVCCFRSVTADSTRTAAAAACPLF